MELINKLRQRTITTKDYNRLKTVISKRIKIRGDTKQDVIMITIEKICYSRVEVQLESVNLFVRQRITDAYYKAGIANTNGKKVSKQNKIKYSVVEDDTLANISIAKDVWKEYASAELRADWYYVIKKGKSADYVPSLIEGELC